MPDIPLIIGIDLGTTNSVAAWVDHTGDGTPAILARDGDSPLTPSVVTFESGGSVVVGRPARELAQAHPERTVFSVKRLMGKALSELPEMVKLLPYTVVDYADKIAAIRLPGVEREVTPQELSAMILRDVRATAETALGRKVKKAVVTVPAYFDDAQRQATRDAGRIAGIEVVRIVNEPTAAALAYGLDKKKKGTIAVFDLGGGTFDVSILKLTGGVFKVIATAGDTFLGGDDFDRELVHAALADIERDWNVDLRRDAKALHGLRDAAEACKQALTSAEQATFSFETNIDGAPRTYARTITRSEFNALIAPDVDRAIACCKAALADANISVEKIDEVVLVGGSTRVPLVRQRVGEFFGRTPHTDLNPDEVVALGAAVQAHILAGGRRDLTLLDVVPLSLGIEVYGGAMQKMIARNTTVPCQAQDMFSTFADEQTAFKLHVLQGERELARDCRSLGTFVLRGIPKMPAGMPRLQVAFALDANGTLTVTAHELRSAQELEVQIEPSHGLSKDEVNALVQESIEHAMEDMSARFVIERRNRVDLLVRVTHKELARAREGQYFPANKLDAIEVVVAEAETVLGQADVVSDRLDEVYEKLAALTVPLAEALVEHTARAEFLNRAIDDPRFSALVADNMPVDKTASRHVQVDE